MHEKGLILTPLFSSAGKSQKESVIYCVWSKSCHCFTGNYRQRNIRNQVFPSITLWHFCFFSLFCRFFPFPPLPSASFSSSEHHLHLTINTLPSSIPFADYHQHTISNTPPSCYQSASTTHNSSSWFTSVRHLAHYLLFMCCYNLQCGYDMSHIHTTLKVDGPAHFQNARINGATVWFSTPEKGMMFIALTFWGRAMYARMCCQCLLRLRHLRRDA